MAHRYIPNARELLGDIGSVAEPGEVKTYRMSREEIDRLYPAKPSAGIAKRAYNFRRKDGTIDIL